MTKMIDVAKLAGVSTATVSRVLSGNPNVKESLKIKVLEAINQLDYKPNKLASSLRKMESRTIVVVVPDISNPFFSDIILGIKKVAHCNGYYVLLGDTQNDVENEIAYTNLIQERLADGVILLTARMPKHKIQELAHSIPVVLSCEYIDGIDISTVTIDNISSSRKVVDHLVQMGHSRIGIITGPLNIVLSRDRLKGYRQSLYQNEIEPEESLVQEGDFSMESGYQMCLRLLSLNQPPTAIFASNDEMAIGTIKAIKHKGLRVPEDVAVVGFDNVKLSTIVDPELSTVSQPKMEIGRKSMELLLKEIRNEPIEKRQIVLHDELIIRESCGSLTKSLSI
ncbi:LacI family DNA-binding transcriptional regulator [Peribacillus sp. SCS-155]|uniref:LacI family DNA-binding transcriptional regulator n=1 Tax=Peribacillus sedimenti TaxID=3115297 RepID=UPI003905E127